MFWIFTFVGALGGYVYTATSVGAAAGALIGIGVWAALMAVICVLALKG